MSLYTLVHHEAITVATDQRVFSAEHTGALTSILDQAAQIRQLHDSASERMSQAEEAGFARGRSEGEEKGQALTSERCVERLLLLDEQSTAARDEVRGSAMALALDIVRAIARDVGSEQMLGALASQAAHELLPNETATLRVHPDQVDAVQQRLVELQGEESSSSAIVDVVGDGALDTQGCVLQTTSGQVVADLETQLRVMQERMQRRAGNSH